MADDTAPTGDAPIGEPPAEVEPDAPEVDAASEPPTPLEADDGVRDPDAPTPVDAELVDDGVRYQGIVTRGDGLTTVSTHDTAEDAQAWADEFAAEVNGSAVVTPLPAPEQ